MGNQKQKWTAEEEEALLAGITKHGPGKWKNILKDPEFAPFLTHRSNIDLKVLPYFFFVCLQLIFGFKLVLLFPLMLCLLCFVVWLQGLFCDK